MERVANAARDAWKGEVPLIPLVPQAPSNSVFK